MRPTHLRDGRKNKSALGRADISPSSIARFHSKYKIVTGGCWLWTGSCFHFGHGQFVLERVGGHQPHVHAHRVAYVLAKGDIPQGYVVMHTCDVPACVNPDHLVLGDQADNVADSVRKGRMRGWTRPDLYRLTDEQVLTIRNGCETGAALAERFGVSPATISLIRRGHRRKVA